MSKQISKIRCIRLKFEGSRSSSDLCFAEEFLSWTGDLSTEEKSRSGADIIVIKPDCFSRDETIAEESEAQRPNAARVQRLH